MPPIAIVFFVTGIAVWANFLYFAGVGATAKEGGPDPLKGVGWITLVAGLSDFVQAWHIQQNQLLAGDLDLSIRLGGLVAIYAGFFTWLGIHEILGLDLRSVGNIAVPVGIVPLFYWKFFTPGWMFRSILIVWAIVFLAIAATTYGKFKAKNLAALLFITATYTFWTPAVYIALDKKIP